MGRQISTENKAMNTVKASPLRNEKIFVRFVPHDSGFVGNNKNHVMYGGKVDGYFDTLCVPVLRSTGKYKNILTNDEKDFLEAELGLDNNALSVYRTEDNYWDDFTVTITKEGLHLDLSDPEDFIKYKVLLANSDIVAPSVEERINRPKATYWYEIVRENEETSLENAKMDATMSCYKEFQKIDGNLDAMRVLIELLDSRPYAQNTKSDFLRSRANTLIQKDPKKFLSYITDDMLPTKIVLRRSQELGKVVKRGDAYYLAADNSPLCEIGENPTLEGACRFLNTPAHQDIKYILESEVDKNRIETK